MHIWSGCKLPEDFERKIRAKCQPLGEKLSLDMSGFTLPQHISLKISFPVEKEEPVLDAVVELLAKQMEFYVNPKAVEQSGNILWLTFDENAVLTNLHAALDTLLLREFGVAQHPFDKAFAFHSTLLMGEPKQLAQAKIALADLCLPERLKIDTCLLGVSETGKSGSFRMVRSIPLDRS